MLQRNSVVACEVKSNWKKHCGEVQCIMLRIDVAITLVLFQVNATVFSGVFSLEVMHSCRTPFRIVEL
jgi:hypothetical protein